MLIPTRSRLASGLEIIAAPQTRQIVGVLIFAILTALSARIALPIPGTVVPFTFQPLAVLLAGALLGSRLGAISQITYLSAGLIGLPVFALGSILGPSGGYLLAYPVAAFVAGAFTGRHLFRDMAVLLAGLTAIYAGGAAWLSLSIGFSTAFTVGVLPFVLPDLVKVVLALVIARRISADSRSIFQG